MNKREKPCGLWYRQATLNSVLAFIRGFNSDSDQYWRSDNATGQTSSRKILISLDWGSTFSDTAPTRRVEDVDLVTLLGQSSDIERLFCAGSTVKPFEIAKRLIRLLTTDLIANDRSERRWLRQQSLHGI